MEHASGSGTPCLWCAGNHPQGSLLHSPGLGTPYGRGCRQIDTMCHEKLILLPSLGQILYVQYHKISKSGV